MNIKIVKINIFSVIALLFIFTTVQAQVFLDLETGLVASGYNNVQIPKSTGTRISLSKDLKTDPALFSRFRLGCKFGAKHTLSILMAPLSLNAAGKVNIPVAFNKDNFPANIDLKGKYRFNSYRLTYRYDILQKKDLKLGIGFTAKIRDAAVSLTGNQIKSEKTNVGFVPLLNFRLEWLFGDQLSLLFEGDALAAKQGRAEDVLLALRWHINKDISLKAGYRIVEGGANVEEVYNFALIHYLVAGLTFHF